MSTTTVDVLEICRRALTEWGLLDPIQGRLINVHKDVPILHPNNELKMQYEIDEGVPSDLLTKIPQAELQNLKCTRLTLYQFYPFINMIDERYQDVITAKNFTDPQPDLQSNLAYLSHSGIIDNAVIKSLSKDTAESYYWITRLRRRDVCVVMGILNSIPGLKAKGHSTWTLPSGQEIPLDSLKFGVIEVCPKDWYIVRSLHYQETQTGTICGGMVILDVEPHTQPDRYPNIKIFRYEAGIGPIQAHTVLFVDLENKKKLIIDPTGLQYKMRGPKGSLVWYGELSEYEAAFPGNVVRTMLDFTESVDLRSGPETYKDSCAVAYWKGNGPCLFVDRLSSNVLKYLERRGCSYCGQIEGPHEIKVHYSCPTYYKIQNVALLKCVRCMKAKYCNSVCQKFDWKLHKLQCIKASA